MAKDYELIVYCEECANCRYLFCKLFSVLLWIYSMLFIWTIYLNEWFVNKKKTPESLWWKRSLVEYRQVF